VIEVRGLTKRYGSTVAVDRLSFDVPPGAVTGFLGLNGSGKSTTMRMILGLDAPDAGHARIGGQAYRQLRWPLREAGALLESGGSCSLTPLPFPLHEVDKFAESGTLSF
jgi:ABC-2 type transport system ATP-binding protein